MLCLVYNLVELTFTAAEPHRLWLKSIDPVDRVLVLLLFLVLGEQIPLMVPLSSGRFLQKSFASMVDHC